MRSLSIPAPLLGLLLALVAVFALQGWRVAADRHQTLQPRRAAAVLTLGDGRSEAQVERETGAFLLVEPGTSPPPRLGLYELLAERPLVRWIEEPRSRSRQTLIVPLRGLQPGHFALCAVDSQASAGPREMDQPAEQLDVRARFELR